MVPLRNFGVGKEGVVTAREASFHTLGDIVVKREVGSEWVVRVLPVAVLWLVDGLLEVSGTTRKNENAAMPIEILTNHSSTK